MSISAWHLIRAPSLQVGIVSGGLECAGTSPGVYVNVFNYVDWIARAVKHLR